VLGKLAASRERTRLADLLPGADDWLGTVRLLRPARSWEAVTEAVNERLPPGWRRFTRDRLVRSVRLFVQEGLAEPALLEGAARRRRREL
jgi:hypothetical protein